MASSRPVRTLLTVIMDLLFVVALILVARIVIEFFGALAAQAWGKSVVSATSVLVIPFGVEDIATPYGGAFNVSASLTVLVLLAIEWALGVARRAS